MILQLCKRTLLVLSCATLTSAAMPPPAHAAGDPALAAAQKAIAASKAARGGLPLACVALVDFRREGKWSVGELREKHGGRCGGDPNTAPRLTTVWVERASRAVFFENLEGDKVPAARFAGR